MNWNLMISIGAPIIITTVIGCVAWLLKKAIENLENTDKRIEKKVNEIELFTRTLSDSLIEIRAILRAR